MKDGLENVKKTEEENVYREMLKSAEMAVFSEEILKMTVSSMNVSQSRLVVTSLDVHFVHKIM